MEFVYVVPRIELFPDCYPQGLTLFGHAQAGSRLHPRPQNGSSGGAGIGALCPGLSGPETERLRLAIVERGFFVERDYAERTPSWKQVIPYSIVSVDGRILLMRRLSGGGDSRLFDKLSIGVGGHINPADVGTRGTVDPVLAGTRREIAEELEIRGTYELQAIGLLNDDSNPVGAVHVGWVQVLLVNGSVGIREEGVLEGRLATVAELRELLASGANFESWSRILVQHLEALLPEPLPATT
jgi:predicted NUDIX family phosphoesterase